MAKWKQEIIILAILTIAFALIIILTSYSAY